MKRHMPTDLLTEILSTLPAKSLVRLRCVSKSWLSLISDPDFRHRHLKNLSNKTHILAVEDKQRNCVLRCSDTFETNSDTLHTLGEYNRQGSWNVVCSIDGLVLLKCRGLGKIRVWNPSIRKFHDIAPLPEIEEYKEEDEIGLGYDPLVKDYKYVKVMITSKSPISFPLLVAVYTLGPRSWKIIPFRINGCSLHWISVVSQTPVYLRGSLYFTCCSPNRGALKLVSFDLSSEVFSYISVPECWDLNNILRSSQLTLVDDGCTLAVLDLFCGALWALDGSCWTQRYSFGFSLALKFPTFSYHKNDTILIGFDDVTSKTSNVVLSYSLETNTEEILLQMTRRTLEIHGYAESLMMLE